jgi:hypothetical protein
VWSGRWIVSGSLIWPFRTVASYVVVFMLVFYSRSKSWTNIPTNKRTRRLQNGGGIKVSLCNVVAHREYEGFRWRPEMCYLIWNKQLVADGHHHTSMRYRFRWRLMRPYLARAKLNGRWYKSKSFSVEAAPGTVGALPQVTPNHDAELERLKPRLNPNAWRWSAIARRESNEIMSCN